MTALVPLGPISIWAALSDLSTMKIPNKTVLSLMAVYLVVGLIALPLPEYGLRMTHFLVILVIGFLLNMAGMLGAGVVGAEPGQRLPVGPRIPTVGLVGQVLGEGVVAQEASRR